MPRFNDPEPLGVNHDVEEFDCGTESLSVWLKKHAPQAVATGSARTFVVHDNEQNRIVGYHALAAAPVSRAEGHATSPDPRRPSRAPRRRH